MTNSINKKLRRKSIIQSKFFGISEEGFTSIFHHNCFSESIIKLYSPKIENIEYKMDIKYEEVTPMKVLDPEGGIQYYKGGLNKHG